MKKRNYLLAIGIITSISLSAWAYQKSNHAKETATETSATIQPSFMEETGFFYGIRTRFSGLTKSQLQEMTSVHDFLPAEHLPSIITYHSINVIQLDSNYKWSDNQEKGTTENLTSAQQSLLQSFDYSTHFLLRVDYEEMNRETGKLEFGYSTPHHTVIPAKQANYEGGIDKLIDYLKQQSKDETEKADQRKLEPGRINFTITKEGKLSEVYLNHTCGYTYLDHLMIQTLNTAPALWIPAENKAGEKVDQELSFSFGMMGC